MTVTFYDPTLDNLNMTRLEVEVDDAVALALAPPMLDHDARLELWATAPDPWGAVVRGVGHRRRAEALRPLIGRRLAELRPHPHLTQGRSAVDVQASNPTAIAAVAALIERDRPATLAELDAIGQAALERAAQVEQLNAVLVTVDAAAGRYPFDFDPARTDAGRIVADVDQWRRLVDWFDAQVQAKRSAQPLEVYARECARLHDPTYPSLPRLPLDTDGHLDRLGPAQRFTRPYDDDRPVWPPAVEVLEDHYRARDRYLRTLAVAYQARIQRSDSVSLQHRNILPTYPSAPPGPLPQVPGAITPRRR